MMGTQPARVAHPGPPPTPPHTRTRTNTTAGTTLMETPPGLRRLRTLGRHLPTATAVDRRGVAWAGWPSDERRTVPAPPAGPLPNVVLIMTDQHRGDCLGIDPGCPSPLLTPNLDFIGRSGTHFRRGYTESPSCIPARRTLMTGTAPAANGCVGMGGG